MQQQIKLEEYLQHVYNKYPQAFEPDNIKRLIWYVWTNYDKLVVNDQLSKEAFIKATSPESITRARRSVIEKNDSKAPESVRREQLYHDYYRDKLNP